MPQEAQDEINNGTALAVLACIGNPGGPAGEPKCVRKLIRDAAASSPDDPASQWILKCYPPISGGEGRAGSDSDDRRMRALRQHCENDSGDSAIAACTSVIRAGIGTSDEMSNYYMLRGMNYTGRVMARTKTDAITKEDKTELDLAMSDLSQAIKLNPGNAVAVMMRGATYAREGRNDLALNDLANAEALAVRNGDTDTQANALYMLGDVKVISGRIAEGDRDIAAACAMKPKPEKCNK